MKSSNRVVPLVAFLLLAVASAASSTTDPAHQVAMHLFSRRLASGGGTVWVPTTYKCKMDMSRPFNHSDPTQNFVVKCSEHYSWWPTLVVFGLIGLILVIPLLVRSAKRQIHNCTAARERRREEKAQRQRNEALRRKAFLQA